MPDGGGVEVITQVACSAAAGALPGAVGLRRRRGRDRGHPRRRARLRDQDDLRRRSWPMPCGEWPTATRSSRRGWPASCSTRSPPSSHRSTAVDAAPDERELDQLTPREREVLRHIARGYMYKEVAQRLGISVKDGRGARLGGAAQAAALEPPRAQPLGGAAAAGEPRRALNATCSSSGGEPLNNRAALNGESDGC